MTQYKIQIFLTRVLLDVCFYEYIIDIFYSSNYKYAFSCSFNLYIYILSWVIFVPSVFMVGDIFTSELASRMILRLLYIIQFIPFTTMLGGGCFSSGFSVITVLYWIFIAIFSVCLLKRNYKIYNKIHVPYVEKTLIFQWGVILISGLAVLYFCYLSGFRIDLDIFNAYDLRDDARNISRTDWSTYLLGLSRILIPTGLVYSIRKKKIWMSAILICFAILDYSFDGSKTLYFVCIAAIFVAIFYNNTFNKYIPLLLNTLLVVGLVDYLIDPLAIVYRLVIRRLFFVPNVINNAYYDYMLTHDPNMFSNVLRFLDINNSYDVAYVIGTDYFRSLTMSANTGTVGDAIWQFGYLGSVVLPLLIVLLLKFFDYCTRHTPFEMLIIPCVVFSYYLNNSSFTAACFTHGLIPFCLIIISCKRVYCCEIYNSNRRN